MNTQLKQSVSHLFDTYNRLTPAVTRRELTLEIQKYLSYIIATNGKVSDGETRFVNDYLELDLNPRELANFITAYDVFSKQFESTLPSVFSAHIDDAAASAEYIEVMDVLGRECIVSDEVADAEEIDNFTKYMMLLIGSFNEAHPDKRRDFNPPSVKDSNNSFMFGDKKDDDDEKSLADLLKEMDELIGLQSVKKCVYSLVHFQDIQQERVKRGMKKIPISNHLVFTGNPGTGKTTMARMIARIYYRLGITSNNHLIEVDRSGLVAGYVGQTAIEVKNVMESAKGGVLFIDEAYSLANGGFSGDYGHEAIQTILKRMEDDRDSMVVIVAGYPKLMEQFIESNPGLRSRFSRKLFFPDYTPEELIEILKYMADKNKCTISEDGLAYAYSLLKKKYENRTENFANAREVRNMFEAAFLNQADRLFGKIDLTDDDIRTLTAEDFRYNELYIASDN